jgi:dTMP kinase
MRNGHLVVLEGPDGVGKSTLTRETLQLLKGAGVAVLHGSFPGNEEGTLGRLVYDLHHRSSNFGIATIAPIALQTMHVAAHADAIGRWILPGLEEGKVVILDRYWWSTWVYGLAAGVSHEHMEAAISLERSIWGACLPSLVLYVTRDRPLRAEDDTAAWRDLNTFYSRLAAQESTRYPVVEVSNTGPIEAAAATIRTQLTFAGILPSSNR